MESPRAQHTGLLPRIQTNFPPAKIPDLSRFPLNQFQASSLRRPRPKLFFFSADTCNFKDADQLLQPPVTSATQIFLRSSEIAVAARCTEIVGDVPPLLGIIFFFKTLKKTSSSHRQPNHDSAGLLADQCLCNFRTSSNTAPPALDRRNRLLRASPGNQIWFLPCFAKTTVPCSVHSKKAQRFQPVR
ncbi:hypothetical protein U1Q18_017392 [Sarracenia purpurea var. burkii]